MPCRSLFAAYTKHNIPLNNAFFSRGAGFFVSGKGSFDALLISLSQAGYEEWQMPGPSSWCCPSGDWCSVSFSATCPVATMGYWFAHVIAMLFFFISHTLWCSPGADHSPRLAEARAGREVVPHLPVSPSGYLLSRLCFLTLTAAVRQWTSLAAKPWWDNASTAETAAWTAWDHACLIWQRGRILAPSLTLICCFPDIGP